MHQNFLHGAGVRRGHADFHLHRLKDEQDLPPLDAVARACKDPAHHAGHLRFEGGVMPCAPAAPFALCLSLGDGQHKRLGVERDPAARMPISRQAQMMRTAISPRLATRSFFVTYLSANTTLADS